MRLFLYSVGALLLGILLASIFYTQHQQVEAWGVADLPRHLAANPKYNNRVRVKFELPLQPTKNPLVFHYHPGFPAAVAPLTYELHFSLVPPAAPGLLVEGKVRGLSVDGVRRVSSVPGYVILKDCIVVPQTP